MLLFLVLLLFPAQKANAALSLSPVEDFSAACSGGHVVLSWRAEPAAEGYRIRRSCEDGHKASVVMLESGDVCRWEDLNSAVGALYRYEIEPYRWDDLSRVFGGKTTLLIRVKPDPVTALFAVNNGHGADLSWAPASGADEYVVFRRGEDGVIDLGKAAADEPFFTDRTAKPGVSYVYSVAASCFRGREERVLSDAAEAELTVYPDLERLELDGMDRMKPGQSWPVIVRCFPPESDEALLWSSSDESVVSIRDGRLCGLKDGTASVTVTGGRSGVSRSLTVRVDSKLIQIALTFDDGPGNRTQELLQVLEECGVRCTFFLCGYRLETYRETVALLGRSGNELGYHTWNHGHVTKQSRTAILGEYRRFQALLTEYAGRPATVWRSPYGESNRTVRGYIDLPECLWNLDTLDWLYKNPERLYKDVTEGLFDGAIILCHDMHDTTVEGIIPVIRELSQREDIQFLTVTQMLSRDGTPPEVHRRYPD